MPATMQTGETVRQADTPKTIATTEKKVKVTIEMQKVKIKKMQMGETVRQAKTRNAIATGGGKKVELETKE